MLFTVPPASATTLVSIFIASTAASVSPLVTAWPGLTPTEITLPFNFLGHRVLDLDAGIDFDEVENQKSWNDSPPVRR